jgi:hypothetical protein
MSDKIETETKKIKLEEESSTPSKRLDYLEGEPPLKIRDRYPYTLHAMIDLETKATSTKSMIMQIGAIVFTPNEKGQGFGDVKINRILIDVEDVRESDVYDIDPKTIQWWEKKERKEAWETYIKSPNKLPLKKALELLFEFLTDYRISKYWAKPPRFDFAILEHAFITEGLELPWNHWSVQDVRTIDYINNTNFIKKFYDYNNERRNRIKNTLPSIPLLEHNPVHDCLLQAYDVIFFFEQMKELKTQKQSLEEFIIDSYYQGKNEKDKNDHLSETQTKMDCAQLPVSRDVSGKRRFVLSIEPFDPPREEEEVSEGN